MVGVTKYCKIQDNLLAGSVSASAAESWAPLNQHRENPSVQALFGEKYGKYFKYKNIEIFGLRGIDQEL